MVKNPILAHLNQIYINGKALPQFYPSEHEYWVSLKDPTKLTITADAPDGVTYHLKEFPENKEVVIRAQSAHQAQEYTLYFKKRTSTMSKKKSSIGLKQRAPRASKPRPISMRPRP